MKSQQDRQEDRYAFPYHYIPQVDAGGFSQTEHWSWGYRYLGRLQVVRDLLSQAEFTSLLDVGCGDGRFLREASRWRAGRRLLGVDISRKAVALAAALNPELEFRVRDICLDPGPDRFDVVTLLDVIEHIPPPELDRFIDSVAGLLRPGGLLVLTVPHRNAPVTPQHHQHFDSVSLSRLLRAAFEEPRVLPFDHLSGPLRALALLLGGTGQQFVITNRRLNGLFLRYYLRTGLYGAGEDRCLRLAASARKR